MEYEIISGIVENLHITKGYEDLAFTEKDKNIIGMAAIAAAATGNSTSSTILSSSSGGAEVDMEFFTCSVAGRLLKGRFHKVGFKSGETIDFVVSVKDGIGEVHGARDQTQRYIWTLPYRTRGHIAQKESDIRSSLAISSVVAGGGTIALFYDSTLPLERLLVEILWLTLPVFTLTLFINFMVRRRFYRFSYEATKIFEIFGFRNPALMDLPKCHSKADKEYYQEIGKPRPWDDVPWRYRYRLSTFASSLTNISGTSQKI